MKAQADQLQSPGESKPHICPWWLAYTFDNPLRRMVHPAEKILGPFVAPGMTTLDFGCGFGHFSLGMARLTGPAGCVVAADVQQKMLAKTMARARKAGLDRIIRPHRCNGRGIGAVPKLDFALVCNALHETPDPGALLVELFAAIKEGGRLLLMEPWGHMKSAQFEAEIALTAAAGFEEAGRPKVIRQMCVLLHKPEERTGA